jgi:hypothetical protein
MKRKLFLLVNIFALFVFTYNLAALQTQQKQEASDTIKITLSTSTDIFTLGQSSIPIAVTLTNTSKTPIYLTTFSSGADFLIRGLRFNLTLDKDAVPKAGLHKEFDHRDGSVDRIRINPSSSKLITIDVKRLFEVTQPGSYLLVVTTPPDKDGKIEVTSQPLKFTITN